MSKAKPCLNICHFCLFPVPVRDPWLPVRGGMPCGGAAGSAQGADGEPDNSTQPGTRGVKPATAFSQHRGSLQSVGPKPGWAASEAGGEEREISHFFYVCKAVKAKYIFQKNPFSVIKCLNCQNMFCFLLKKEKHSGLRSRLWVTHALEMELGWAQTVCGRYSLVWKTARQVGAPAICLCCAEVRFTTFVTGHIFCFMVECEKRESKLAKNIKHCWKHLG